MVAALQIQSPALAKRFSEALREEDVDVALDALRSAMRSATTMERCGGGRYMELEDHKTRAWAAVQFLRVVGLVAPQQVRHSGSVGVVHASLDELLDQASDIGRQRRAADIVGQYLGEGAKSIDLEEREELVPVEA